MSGRVKNELSMRGVDTLQQRQHASNPFPSRAHSNATMFHSPVVSIIHTLMTETRNDLFVASCRYIAAPTTCIKTPFLASFTKVLVTNQYHSAMSLSVELLETYQRKSRARNDWRKLRMHSEFWRGQRALVIPCESSLMRDVDTLLHQKQIHHHSFSALSQSIGKSVRNQ